MKIEILPSNSKLPLRDGWLRLTEKDFNNYESFFAKHPDILPESAEELEIKGVLEVHPYPLIIIRHADWLLKAGGSLKVESLFRYDRAGYVAPYYQLRYLISQSFGDKIKCVAIAIQDNVQTLSYEKVSSSLPENDSIERWSFGICSNGSQNERVLRLIDSIIKQNIPEFEIIVCGPAPSTNLPSCVKVVDDAECYTKGDIRIPIGKKKNLIAKHAKYNNMCIMHDRYLFVDDWFVNMRKYGNYFDVITMMCYDVEKSDQVMSSLNMRSGNFSTTTTTTTTTLRFLKNIKLQTQDFPQYLYINGGFFIAKKHLYVRIPIPNNLHWAEAEDIVWGQLLPLNGALIGIDEHNKVKSYAVRLASSKVKSRVYLRRTKDVYRFLHDKLVATKEYSKAFQIPYKKLSYYALSILEFFPHLIVYTSKKIGNLMRKI